MSQFYIDPDVLNRKIENIRMGFWCETEEERMAFLDAATELGYIWNSGDDLHHFDTWEGYKAPLGFHISKGSRVTKTTCATDCQYMVAELIFSVEAIQKDELLGILEV